MNARQRIAALVLAVAIGLPSFALFDRAPLCDPDVGWHLAFGEYIVAHRTIPTRDVFRFTPQEHPLHLHGWLSQVFFYALERTGGLGLFRLVTALIMLGTLAILARLLYTMCGSVHLTALGVLAFLLTSIHLFHPRARIFTPPLFMLGFEMVGMDEIPLSARRLLGLFLFTVVWMNLHAEASVLPLYIVVQLLSEMIARRSSRQRIASLVLAAVLTVGALFVSPLGASWLSDARQNYRINRENSWEWFNLFEYQTVLDRAFSDAPPDYSPMYVHLLGHPYSLYATVIVAACYVVALALRPKGPAAGPGVLVNLWALFSAFSIQRNSWLLFIPIASTLQIVTLRFGRAALRPRSTHGSDLTTAPCPLWQGVLATAGVLLLVTLTFADVVRPLAWREYDDSGWDARMFPTKAAAFLDAASIRGNTFAQQEWGGYLIHQRPDLPVFMHGHWAEAPNTYADYQAIFDERPGFAELLDRYGATLLVVPPFWGTDLPAATWVEVFRNLQSRIFIRRTDVTSLAAVEAYYRALGIPFSRATGFDPEQTLATAPAWAHQFWLQKH